MLRGKKKRIENKSIRYRLLWLTAKFYFFIYHKKIEVYGKENIPNNNPIIFAPNHQNAVIDPLAILFTQKKMSVFLARSDVFKGKFMTRLLNFMKILPVYRQRDGVENLSKNEEIFNTTVRILKNNVPVCLMAEGNHGNKNILRPLVKGIFRIAFSAQESLEDKSKDVQIVPVGIYYDDYAKFNQRIVVNYGKPISVGSFSKHYKEKPALTINKLKTKLAMEMSMNMIDVKKEEFYLGFNFIQHEFSKSKNILTNLPNRFFKQLEITGKLLEATEKKVLFMPQLNFLATEYVKLLDELNLRHWVVKKENFSIFNISSNLLFSAILLPIFIVGYIINWIPYKMPIIPTKKIKDRQFHGSVKYVLMIIISSIYYPIIGLVVGLISKSIPLALSLVVAMPILGFLALHIYYRSKKTFAKIKYRSLIAKKDPKVIKIKELYKKIDIITSFILSQQ